MTDIIFFLKKTNQRTFIIIDLLSYIIFIFRIFLQAIRAPHQPF